jgi:hypothetical protein
VSARLVDLSASPAAMRERFNLARDRSRFVVLVSPT